MSAICWITVGYICWNVVSVKILKPFSIYHASVIDDELFIDGDLSPSAGQKLNCMMSVSWTPMAQVFLNLLFIVWSSAPQVWVSQWNQLMWVGEMSHLNQFNHSVIIIDRIKFDIKYIILILKEISVLLWCSIDSKKKDTWFCL